ncbi:LytR C-terminal domain-containing protein [Streptomyces sp. HUAS TT20]|uniref:LytR C-terminal domain-containing protein n=1 Tax=Streptomyces sp. HUAS TT20 TaxID=3447509 RepID=UPI0021D98912|nr:LytR C-terminal domain-containing protein [Streptomyces sp. HUAS 15-9]UXY28532.1 LytR C-terminal domain-containing protein [Streptomyces sp. HUAS 15-9]
MSMLTPPGMGGQYRITGDKYPRMRPPRRRGRLVFGLVASVTALGLVGWGTLQLIDVFTGGGKKAAAAGSKADCATKASPSATPAVALPEPGGITVNVYNATPRSGLAKATADELKKRGFRIGEVGNASAALDGKIKGTGLLIGPASALNTSLPVLATQLASAERRTDAGRKGTDLDLVIGTDFKTLTKQTDADKALAKLTTPRTTSAASKKNC